MTQRRLQPALCLGALLLLLASALPASEKLPDLGDPSAALLSAEQEYRLGRAWLRNLRGQTAAIRDPLIQEYSENLIYRLASHSELQAPDIALIVINSKDINAFAVPGGVIGLNAGLFLNAETADEVGAVVAHEIAHVSQRHFLRRYAESQRMNRAVLAAMLASIAVAIAGDPEAGMAGMAASQAAAIQQQLAYSRAHEREADRVGMQTLVATGMDPDAMPRFFERMMRDQQYAGSVPEFLRTHPVTEERVADSRARARTLGDSRLNESLYFLLIKARILAGFFTDASEGMTWFADHYHGDRQLSDLAAGYGYALCAIRAGEYDKATNTLDRLRERAPDEQWFRLARAEMLMAQDRHAEAVRLLEDMGELMPGNYTVSVFLAQALLQDKRPQAAADILEQQLKRRPDDPALWFLAADAYGEQQKLAMAHLARGEYLFLTGRDQKAKDQLNYALAKSTDRFALHARIKARLKEMEKLSAEEF